MKALVTGSAGHLGEALVRVLRAGPHDAVGLDIVESPHTDVVGSIARVVGAKLYHAETFTQGPYPVE